MVKRQTFLPPMVILRCQVSMLHNLSLCHQFQAQKSNVFCPWHYFGMWVRHEPKTEEYFGTQHFTVKSRPLNQGTLKGEVSLYCWPPVWLVWNQLYDNWHFLFWFAKQTNPNRSNRRSTVQWYFPVSLGCINIRPGGCDTTLLQT